MSVPKMMPCDQRERWRNIALYGHQMKRNTPQRVYCRDCMSRSGPNISPPNSIAPVATLARSTLPVTPPLLGGLGLLPRTAAVATGRAAGRVAYKFAGGLRRTGETNLRLAFPDMDACERARLLRASF